MSAPDTITPRIAAALSDTDPDIRQAAQYALDTGDMSELDWFENRENAIENYRTWAHSYEVRTGRDAPDMDQLKRWEKWA